MALMFLTHCDLRKFKFEEILWLDSHFQDLYYTIKPEVKSRRWLTQKPGGGYLWAGGKATQSGKGGCTESCEENGHVLMLRPGAGASAHVTPCRSTRASYTLIHLHAHFKTEKPLRA